MNRDCENTVGNGDSRRDSKKKLLIVSCSAKKSNLVEGPAINIYDGPMFKIIRKHFTDMLDTKIISAKYGLIDVNEKISTYEMKMTPDRAENLRDSVSSDLKEILGGGNYSEVFIELGKVYQKAVDIKPEDFPNTKFLKDEGTIGLRLHNLKKWLEDSRETGNIGW